MHFSEQQKDVNNLVEIKNIIQWNTYHKLIFEGTNNNFNELLKI